MSTMNPYSVDHPKFNENFLYRNKIEGFKSVRDTGLLPDNDFWQWVKYKRESSPVLHNGELRFDHYHPHLIGLLITDTKNRVEPMPAPPNPIDEIPEIPEIPYTPICPVVPPSVSPNVVPEPSSIQLLGIPIVLIFIYMIWREK